MDIVTQDAPKSAPSLRPADTARAASLLSTRAVAAELGVTPERAQRPIRAGELPAYAVGRGGKRITYRVAPNAVRLFKERGRLPAGGAR